MILFLIIFNCNRFKCYIICLNKMIYFLRFINFRNLLYYGLQSMVIINNIKKRCCNRDKADYKINKIRLKYNTNCVVFHPDYYQSLDQHLDQHLELDWNIFNRYCPNCELVDIEYYYDNKLYNIQYERSQRIQFPIEFDDKTLIRKKFMCVSDDILNDIFIKYAGPKKDFYQSNNINIKFNNICYMNQIMKKELTFTNSMLEEKIYKLNDVIIL